VHGDDLEPGSDANPSRGEEISPVRFRPLETKERSATPRRRIGTPLALALAAAILVGAGWFSCAAVPVALEFDPKPEAVTFPGTWLALELGNRVLLRPGTHRVHAAKDGYRPFETQIEVAAESGERFAFALVEAPGTVAIRTDPPAELPVRVGGAARGQTPLTLELPRGAHQIEIQGAPDFADTVVDFQVEGLGVAQDFEVELRSARSPVTVASIPEGAGVWVDGEDRGVTPLTLSLAAGKRRIELRLPGYAVATAELEVQAGTAPELPPFHLKPAPGRVEVSSVPSGAEVAVGADYSYRGRTPLTLALAPGRSHRVRLFKAGYERAERSVEVSAGEPVRLSVALKPKLGRVELLVRPDDAAVAIDGAPHGAGNQTLELVATPHEIVVSKAGHRAETLHVTPRPGFPQHLEVTLSTLEAHREATRPARVQTSGAYALRLVRGGRFEMGSSRQDRGRRPNENRVSIELTHPFYLGVREVTNGEFRGFRPGHRSGGLGGASLDGDEQPVTGVTWEDAARYCNWLSEVDSLPPAYAERDGRLVLATPRTTGYRLPTEAEWVWAARYAGGQREAALRFPWGDSMPPPEGAGNYADASANGTLPNVLGRYRDGYAVSAPVGQGQADALGIRDLGGNVAEWVQDFYQIYPRGLEQRLRDPMGPNSGRYHVIRGASWRDASLSELRLSFRDYGDEARDDLGFRLARDAD